MFRDEADPPGTLPWKPGAVSVFNRGTCCSPAPHVERHQPQFGELDDQHDDHEAAGHSGAHPRVAGADPELHSLHSGTPTFDLSTCPFCLPLAAYRVT